MSIAVDATSLWEPLTGVGWYLSNVLEAVKDEPGIVFRLYGPAGSPDQGCTLGSLLEGRAIELIRYPVPDDLLFPARWFHRAVRLAAPILLLLDRNRVLFAPNFVPSRRFLLFRGPGCCVVHDLAFLRLPWTLHQENLDRLRGGMAWALGRSAAIICPSETIRDELVGTQVVSREKVVAIHHGTGHLQGVGDPSASSPGAEEPYALHVGTLEPRKNLHFLFAVWQQLQERPPPPGLPWPKLVLCGGLGWKAESLLEVIKVGEAEGWLSWQGYTDNDALNAYYRRAEMVICASLYEGFGFPLVEAMVAGVPLIVSDIPVFREVAGEAALYADPGIQAAWLEQIALIHGSPDLRQKMIERGSARVRHFCWRKSARQTLAVLQEIDGGTPRTHWNIEGAMTSGKSPMEKKQRWGDLRIHLDGATKNSAVADHVPPMRRFPGSIRWLARAAARAVVTLSRVITVNQQHYNKAILCAWEELLPRLDEFARELEVLQGEVAQVLATNNFQARRIEALLDEAGARVVGRPAAPAGQVVERERARSMDPFYAQLENRFRGSREEIREKQRQYLPYIRESGAGTAARPVLDLGSGRGEWLELLRQEGMTGYGVETNRIFLDECARQELPVREEDAIAHLKTLSASSIGAVTAFHLLEHLDLRTLLELLDGAMQALQAGGILLCETPNPANLQVASERFWMDPTHRAPLPARLMEFLFMSRGLVEVKVIPLHPPPEHQRIADASEEIVRRFNDYFYGPQDYAVLGVKPAGGSGDSLAGGEASSDA